MYLHAIHTVRRDRPNELQCVSYVKRAQHGCAGDSLRQRCDRPVVNVVDKARRVVERCVRGLVVALEIARLKGPRRRPARVDQHLAAVGQEQTQSRGDGTQRRCINHELGHTNGLNDNMIEGLQPHLRGSTLEAERRHLQHKPFMCCARCTHRLCRRVPCGSGGGRTAAAPAQLLPWRVQNHAAGAKQKGASQQGCAPASVQVAAHMQVSQPCEAEKEGAR